MAQRNIAIWTAVSSKEQAKLYSLENQLAEIRAFVESIPSRYGDTAKVIAEISMADTRSIIELGEAVALYPQSYGILEKLIKSQRINVLICFRRDRLGREDSLIMTIEALCRKHKIKLVALASSIPATLEPVDDEGSGYVAAVEAVSARVEVKRLQSRREIGMKGRVVDMRLFPTRRPWGYSYRYAPTGEIEKIIADPEIKELVRRILVDLFLYRGIGTVTIANMLNDEGIQSPTGKQWSHESVRAIIDRADRYAGWIEWNENSAGGREHVRILGDYEPMISQEEYLAIEQELASRTYNQQRRHNILSGIVYCAGCNQKMFYSTRYIYLKTRTTWVHEMRCRTHRCTAKTSITVAQIIETLQESFTLIASLTDDELIRMVEEKPVEVSPIQLRLTSLETEQRRLQDERKRAIYAFVSLKAITPEELEEQLARIETRLTATASEMIQSQNRLAAALSQNQATERLRTVRDIGLTMLDMRHDNPSLANQWFRKHVIINIHKAGKSNQRIRVRIL